MTMTTMAEDNVSKVLRFVRLVTGGCLLGALVVSGGLEIFLDLPTWADTAGAVVGGAVTAATKGLHNTTTQEGE